jgi:hypothetical protein
MRPAGMHRELCEGVRPAGDDDSGVVRPLVAKVRPKVFPSTLGHDVPPMISRLALTDTPIEASTTGKPFTILEGAYRPLHLKSARSARNGASRLSSSGTGECGLIPARCRSDSSQRA